MDDDNDKIHKNSKSKYNALRNIKIFDFIGKCGQIADTPHKIKNPKQFGLQLFGIFYWYPEPGSNRHGHYWPQDFKSGVSTDSTIRAQPFR